MKTYAARAKVKGLREPGKNDPCWRGSGKKYKKCHLNREFEKPLPYEAASAAMRSAWRQKKCLQQQADRGVCDKIVSAHTIQRSQILERIVDSANHVLTFYPQTPNAISHLQIHRIGWRDASTFTGFCSIHDSLVFRPLETSAFIGSAEQCFLVGYRALCHEVFQKTSAIKTDSVLPNLLDRGLSFDQQVRLHESFAVMKAGSEKGLAEYQDLKAIMDRQLLNREYVGWSRLIINFRGDICVASTGVVSPNRDLEGQPLQVLHDVDAPMESLLCGTAATSEGGTFVLTWPTAQRTPRKFIDSFLKQGNHRLPTLLVQFMFAYIENTYFSSCWWESLSEFNRDQITALAAVANAYYEKFDYSAVKVVPWQITNIVLDDGV